MFIVLCPEKSDRAQRWDFTKDNIVRHLGFWSDSPEVKERLSNYRFMWNIRNPQHKYAPVACMEGHMDIWKKIVREDLKDVVVLEDDADVDWDKVNKFIEEKDKPEGLIYLGGRIRPTVHHNVKWGVNRLKEFASCVKAKDGINLVEQHFIIAGATSYYIPNKTVAEAMLKGVWGKTKYRSTLLDFAMAKIPAKLVKQYFWFPAIVLLDKNCLTLIPPHKPVENNNNYYY